MNKINRDDMLELTRRMTPKRNCFSRIAGAYFDEEGLVDGTFNRHFLKLPQKDIDANLKLAKTVPFSETNRNLRYYPFTKDDEKAGHTWQMLMGLKDCELKNDALLDLFYEFIGEKYDSAKPYAVRIVYGSYDIPIKAKDKENFGNPRRSTNLSYALFARCLRIMRRGRRSADSCFRRLWTEAPICMALWYIRQTRSTLIRSL